MAGDFLRYFFYKEHILYTLTFVHNNLWTNAFYGLSFNIIDRYKISSGTLCTTTIVAVEAYYGSTFQFTQHIDTFLPIFSLQMGILML